MEELFLLINKNKKEIVSYFEGNNMKYKLEKNVLVYEIELFNEKFKVEIRLFHKIATGIRLSCTSLKSTSFDKYLEVINNTKSYLNNIYDFPNSDNTNHMFEYLDISYSKDGLIVHMQGNNGLYNNNKYSFEISMHSFHLKIKESRWPRILLYLGGGLSWGLMMFLTMCYGEYNWINFSIWMSGGLVFFVLFGVMFEFVMKLENRDRFTKINHKHDKNFLEYEQTIEYTLCLNGIVYPMFCPARLYFDEDNVTIAYYKNGLKFIETDIKSLDDKMINNCFSLGNYQGKKLLFLNLEEESDLVKIIKYFNSELYNNEKYNLIYNKVDKVFKEYNPYSLLNENNDVFAYDIFNISKKIYKNSNVTLENVKDFIYESFDEDIDEIILSDLSNLIIKELNNM